MTSEQPWRAVRRIRTHEQVLAQIQQRILSGSLRIGDRLPSEREFTELLGVSRVSVREALRVLEAMGIVDANVGSGREAGSVVAGRSTEALSNLLRLHMSLAQFRLTDLVETRIQLEQASAHRAATSATAADIAHLRSIIDAMTGDDVDHDAFHDLDAEFHISIARASGNALTADLMQALRDAVKHEMKAAFKRMQDWESVVRKLAAEHREILTAVENGDAATAAERITEHISRFYETATELGTFAEESPAAGETE